MNVKTYNQKGEEIGKTELPKDPRTTKNSKR